VSYSRKEERSFSRTSSQVHSGTDEILFDNVEDAGKERRDAFSIGAMKSCRHTISLKCEEGGNWFYAMAIYLMTFWSKSIYEYFTNYRLVLSVIVIRSEGMGRRVRDQDDSTMKFEFIHSIT